MAIRTTSRAAGIARWAWLLPPAAALTVWFASQGALAQTTKIWDITLGIHVSELPNDEFPMRACGTGGGPPSLVLKTFAEFGRCTAEEATGLHEVWFSYDDEAEYFARAYRAAEDQVAQFQPNQWFGHPAVFSFLIDDQGRVQGYRAVSDTRESFVTRVDADAVVNPLKLTVFGFEGWVCTDLPRLEGEEPIQDRFVKELCEKTTEDGRRVSIESRVYSKPGQIRRDGAEVIQGTNDFEASVRLEVISADWLATLGREN